MIGLTAARWRRFDDAADRWFERSLRGRRAADSVMYTATALGDHGVVWVLVGALQAARIREDRRRRLLRLWVGLTAESIVVNGPVKWLFRRSRPAREVPSTRRVRTPRTSSFPSGHSSAAFFAAALLRDDDPLWPVYYAGAAVVAASRVHVRMHHASDVIVGAALGAVLGEITRRLVPVATVGTGAIEVPGRPQGDPPASSSPPSTPRESGSRATARR